ncbi:flavodoxin [Pseudovibrio ascidiaceicola]|uniref:flavodoxin n=1 Tax=Pseudovibrio ascidiaceicola TaxID=285279 RepID=UPI000D68593A|nr:flavodoxin [Pseudovibrio ascidiaceicola]
MIGEDCDFAQQGIFIRANRRRVLVCLGGLVCGGVISSALAREENSQKVSGLLTSTKQLIIFFSHTGFTRQLAQMINDQISADLVQIQPEKAYPEGYNALVALARKEFPNYLTPALVGIGVDLENYQHIYFGSPVWRRILSHPAEEFLKHHDLSGKTIFPFVTHGGWGAGNSFESVKKLTPNVDVREGLSILGSNVTSSLSKVAEWTRKNEQ